METKKYILGLDVSTSTIGICLFEDLGATGKLVELTHLKINGTSKTMLQLWEKAQAFSDFLTDKYANRDIYKVIIEEPLITSSNPSVATKLNKFAGLIYQAVYNTLKVHSEYITVRDARAYGLPELLGKNGKLMSDFPRKVGGLSKTHWGKLLIMYLVGQRYKGVAWLMNSKLKIDKKNFDRADAIVALLGHMISKKHWVELGTVDYWSESNLDHPSCVKVIEKNMAYEKFATGSVDKNKELKPDQKLTVKKRYLQEVFKIQDYINVKL